MQFFQSQYPGIGFASGVMLLMLALCFRVGQRLRPTWGLNWLSLAMALAALRGLGIAANLQGPDWQLGHELLSAAYSGALVVALRRYVGLPVRRPWLEFVLIAGGAFAAVQIGRSAGLGVYAFTLVLTVLYVYLSGLCVGRLGAVAGQAHVLVATVLMMVPVAVAGVGLAVLKLTPYQLPAWSSLVLTVLGLGLLLATSGRLRLELQQELEARTRAEDALRLLNESLEQRIDARTEELQSLVAGLESFNRMVSHDLRGPLGGLTGVAQLAQQAMQAGDTARASHMLDLIGTETRRLGELVTQLLVLARVSNAELALRETPLDQVLAEALQSLALSQGEAAMQRVHTQPLPSAEVDAQLMRQVFINLIGNALKFSSQSDQPEVRVSHAPDARSVVIEVRDNGPGFEPAQAAQLFQPFRRLHGTRFEGSGIGLTIVKRIIERHGGNVWAEGRPSQGASFFFRLPTRARAG